MADNIESQIISKALTFIDIKYKYLFKKISILILNGEKTNIEIGTITTENHLFSYKYAIKIGEWIFALEISKIFNAIFFVGFNKSMRFCFSGISSDIQLKDFLDFTGYTGSEFWNIVEKFYNTN